MNQEQEKMEIKKYKERIQQQSWKEKPIYERLYEDAISRKKSFDVSQGNGLDHRLITVESPMSQGSNMLMKKVQLEQKSVSTKYPLKSEPQPSPPAPPIHQKLYNDAISRQKKKLSECKEMEEDTTTTMPTKIITQAQANELYERLANSKLSEMNEMVADSTTTTTTKPLKIISEAQASELYERLAKAKTEISTNNFKSSITNDAVNNKRNPTPTKRSRNQQLVNELDRKNTHKTIPLSEAIGVYERGIKSKVILAHRLEKEKMIRKWR